MKNKPLLRSVIVILCIGLFIDLHIETVYANMNLNENIANIDRIEKHWWGYRRYISSDQISKFSTELDLLAAELSLIGGLTTPISFLNPLAGVIVGSMFEITSYYCWLLSTYFIKIDKGNGIIVDFANGFIFRVRAM